MRIRGKKSSRDLTQGNIALLIVTYAIPILLGQIFQNLYNSVDSIVVGRFVGVTALAAVSCSTDISHLLVGFFTGLSTGGSILFARLFGKKNYADLKVAIHTAFAFSLLMGVGMAAIGVSISPWLLRIVDCPPDVWDEAVTYLRIYLVGVFFTSVYNVLSGVLRAVGDSRSPFIYLVVASLTNIVLDILLVAVVKLGVAGVAIATIVSQMLSCILILTKMFTTDDVYHLSLKDLRINPKMLLEVVRFGLPSAIQMCVISFSNLFVQKYINGFGSTAIAGVGAAKKLDNYVGMIPKSVGLAMGTFTSQNLGAEKYRRVFKGVGLSIGMSCLVVLAAGSVMFTFPAFFASLFTTDPEALGYAVEMMRTILPFYLVMTAHAVLGNVIRGFGKSTTAMVLSILGMVGFRQAFLAVSMQLNPVVRNVFWSYPAGWMFTTVLELACFLWVSKPFWHKPDKMTLSANG